MLDNVPAELKSCAQWILYRLVWNEERSKWDKLPISAHTGVVSSVTNPETWAGFDKACAQFAAHHTTHNLQGLGFVLGYESGVAGVDLDDVLTSDGRVVSELRLNIADALNSYTELSPSRTGLHVLTRAAFDGGRRADGVEVYGTGRFFTVTGLSYGSPRPLAIRQREIEALVGEIDERRAKAAPSPLNWSAEPRTDDASLFQMASTAVNGEKFRDLWEGRWQAHYSSQSEADYSLINMLGFYSDAPTQISRLFHMSALAQRQKAQRHGYVTDMIARSQDRKPPLVTVPTLPAVHEPGATADGTQPVHNAAAVFDPEEAEEAAAQADNAFAPPEGHVGILARWFWLQSMYPMEELSLVGALGLIAGICGRQYQFQKQGLNLYMLLLAETGAGKDSLGTGMSRLFDSIINPPPNYVPSATSLELGFPAARCFQGPSRLSGKGVLRQFTDCQSLSMVSVLPEFSQTMTSMAAKNANEGLRDFQHVLLEFYTKSAQGASYAGSKNSDKTKDVQAIPSPAFTMLCEGTPKRFYDALNEDMVTDGLMSRFIVIERKGYAEHNPAFQQFTDPPEEIKQYISALCKHILQLRANGDVRIHVAMTADGEAYSEGLRTHYRNRGMSATSETHKYLWMRAHQNLMRMAALVAIGVNVYQPTVTVEQIKWADRIIRRQCLHIVGKFRRGEVGLSDTQDAAQYTTLSDICQRWITASADAFKSYPKSYLQAKSVGLVPYAFLQSRTASSAVFKNDRRGASAALKSTIDAAMKAGLLERRRLEGSQGDFYAIHL